MDTTYDSMGIIFEKVIINDYCILKAISVNECKEIENLMYDVKDNGELDNMFVSDNDNDNSVMGYVYTKDYLINKYGSLQDGIVALKELTFPYIFIQDHEYVMDVITTYKFDKDNNRFFKVAEFKNDQLMFKEKEIEIKDNSFTLDDMIDNKKERIEVAKTNTKSKINIDVKKLYEEMKNSIIGQDEAIKQVISTIDRNYNIDNFRNKTNILLIGPSGSGKTEMFRTISNIINVPMTIEDSEQYSAVGYYGSSVEDMLIKLYVNANEDIRLAEKGILVIDEIDKKVSSTKDDVSGTRVLNSLLSLMEGTTFRINIGTEIEPNMINFDTSYLTVVLVGAFSELTGTEKGMGINSELKKEKKYKDITIDELIKYGLSNELLRRVSVYKLNELTVDNLVNIMKNSKNSALKEYYRYAHKKNIKLHIDDNTIRKIAELAITKKTGASGIKATLNELLNDAFFEVNLNEGIYSSISITEKTINEIPPYKLYKKKKY